MLCARMSFMQTLDNRRGVHPVSEAPAFEFGKKYKGLQSSLVAEGGSPGFCAKNTKDRGFRLRLPRTIAGQLRRVRISSQTQRPGPGQWMSAANFGHTRSGL
jgi:hypothetical protein